MHSTPSLIDATASLGWELAQRAPQEGFQIVELCVEQRVARGEWREAVGMLEQFLTHLPHHVPSLRLLVEVAVDGNLTPVASRAQAQLVDAYLASGTAAFALAVAEDLAEREPSNPHHAERVSQARLLLDGAVRNNAGGAGPPAATPSSTMRKR